ncbi:hypothetical protein ABGB18_46040 [Nonomuraea sp. B12E4]|uniref:hypothetical protein n=1 Tax=Nonomuraea sp. B12E4 TaxID=3153564 RepID=UPI00325E4A88
MVGGLLLGGAAAFVLDHLQAGRLHLALAVGVAGHPLGGAARLLSRSHSATAAAARRASAERAASATARREALAAAMPASALSRTAWPARRGPAAPPGGLQLGAQLGDRGQDQGAGRVVQSQGSVDAGGVRGPALALALVTVDDSTTEIIAWFLDGGREARRMHHSV